MKFAVVMPFHGRHESALPLVKRVLVDSSRKPDEFWVICEDDDDASVINNAVEDLQDLELLGHPYGMKLRVLNTPRDETGLYEVIPYARKINHALDRTEADAVVYLDNNSWPSIDKYKLMIESLELTGVGAVYVNQKRTGFAPVKTSFYTPIDDAFCVLNFTQVMHRVTADRWPLDMRFANPDLADAIFWRRLHESVGPFLPVDHTVVHDEHHIPSSAAAGL